jgi:cystathionine beta-lyase/cystathionine gamma-synthase
MDAMIAVNVPPAEADASQKQGKTRRRQNLTTQVNARIATEVKDGADQAFAFAGIAPSEAIRALYARAARLGSSLRSVTDLVVGVAGEDDALDSREAAFERATHVFDTVLAQYGFSVEVEGITPMTEEEIEEAFYQDYLADGAL